jgi:hypothetical protein
MKPPLPPSPTGSRVKVACSYCGKEMERRNLKSHTLTAHSGLKPQEKVAPTQSRIDFSVKRDASTGNNFKDAKKKKNDDEGVTVEEASDIVTDDVESNAPESKVDPEDVLKEVVRSSL